MFFAERSAENTHGISATSRTTLPLQTRSKIRFQAERVPNPRTIAPPATEARAKEPPALERVSRLSNSKCVCSQSLFFVEFIGLSSGFSPIKNDLPFSPRQERTKKLTAITEIFTSRVSALKLRLRFSTFVLMAAAVSSFVVFYMLTSQAVPVFESILEAGNLRSTCVLGAHQLR